jgi:hypothetical protein
MLILEGNAQKTLILLFVVVFIFYYCLPTEGNELRKIKLVVKNVVYETEEGYISTDKGTFALPNPSTEVAMRDTTFAILIDNLKRVIGKESVLYIDGDTVVGISSESEGINFVPEYKKRKKIVYALPPLKISTILKHWDLDTYRLSIRTPDGTFCIFNTFEVSDYYKKVYRKLRARYGPETNLDAQITILYHEIESPNECVGEIEDIEF